MNAFVCGKPELTVNERAFIDAIGDGLYTSDFVNEWIGRNDNVVINAPAALQAAAVAGFMRAVRACMRAECQRRVGE